MTEGYVSDVPDDDTVMDSPDATLSIDLSKLPPQQALALAREAGFENQGPYTLGELFQGEDATEELNDAEFHLPLNVALVALTELGVVDLPEEQAVDEADVPE